MYKPGTQLIMNELWAAAAARKLGFELDSGRIHWDKKTEFWNTGFSTSADKWRIPVTESGPNAAGQFLPQVDNLVDTETPNKTSILGLGVGLVGAVCKEKNSVKIYGDAANWRTCKRIIERNGIPFPQFSEVIEP